MGGLSLEPGKRLNITNVWIDPVCVGEAARIIAALVKDRPGKGRPAAYVCTPNAEFMMDAQTDRHFMRIINGANLVLADGAGIVLVARLLGYGKINRAPGFDLAKKLVSEPGNYPFSFYFLGGKPGVAEKAAANVIKKYPGARVAGYGHGFFKEDEEPEIVREINESGADILFVALGAPKAEKWIHKHRDELNAAVCMGVGGTLDIFAETAKPAPPFFRAHGLEWLYRLYREPWRAKRMLKLPKYVLFAIIWKIKGCPGLEDKCK